MNMGTEKEIKTEEASRAKAEITPVSAVEEQENSYTLTVELPGVDGKDIDLQLENRTLSVTAENRTGSYEGYTKVLREAPEVRYRVSFDLPEQVEDAGIKAVHKNGLLILTLPKHEAVKARKIAITA